MSDADLLRWIGELDKRQQSGERTDLASDEARSGKSAEKTARTIGISRSKVEKTRTVLDHGNAFDRLDPASTIYLPIGLKQ